jgi:hypothetical protein
MKSLTRRELEKIADRIARGSMTPEDAVGVVPVLVAMLLTLPIYEWEEK